MTRRALAVLTTAALLLTSGAAVAIAEPPGPEEAPDVVGSAPGPEPEEVPGPESAPQTEPAAAPAEPAVVVEPVEAARIEVTGTIQVAVVDRFPGLGDADAGHTGPDHADHDHAELTDHLVYAVTDDGAVLLPDELVPDGYLPGALVTLSLTAPADVAAAEAIERLALADPVVDLTAVEVTARAAGAANAAPVTGARTIVVLPVYYSGSGVGRTTAELRAVANGVRDYWQRNSANRITISVDVREPRQISLPANRVCDLASVTDAAEAAHGIRSNASTHTVAYQPLQGCGFAGVAWTVGPNQMLIDGYAHVHVWAHELGHNFGLGHANLLDCGSTAMVTDVVATCRAHEYQDAADVMGFAVGGDLEQPGSLNVGFAHLLGLAQVRDLAAMPVGTSVDVAPVQSYTGLRGVRMSVPGAGPVYAEYRPATGHDRWAGHWAGVQLRLLLGDDYGATSSYLLDMHPTTRLGHETPQMSVGEIWKVPGTTLTLRHGAQTAAHATLFSGAADPTKVQSYIRRVYRDLFKRDVDPQGLATWTSRLMSGTPRAAVADSITASREYRARLVRASYQTYLNRLPDTPGLRNWLDRMDRGLTIQQMEAGFLGSNEYYRKAGDTDATWVRKLYRDVLGRGATAAEVSSWVARLNAGQSRERIALGFLLSKEHLATVIDGYYREYLGRGIDPRGRDTWVGKIQRGARIEQVIGEIIASNEYYNKG